MEVTFPVLFQRPSREDLHTEGVNYHLPHYERYIYMYIVCIYVVFLPYTVYRCHIV
jgi:hypothetical protein